MSTLAFIVSTAVALLPTTSHAVSNSSANEKVLEIKQAFRKPPRKSIAQLEKEGVIIIAQKAGGDPHGDDPHGDDPHDEVHDSGLPANRDKNIGKAPKDVYGGSVPNSKEPY
ncbi:MAG: hypothetical protein K8F91_21545 [Candidatus Obscuribacterales bacterium]|nr:hypothetical protein [Candidatus Obscuribacterales bacterium]